MIFFIFFIFKTIKRLLFYVYIYKGLCPKIFAKQETYYEKDNIVKKTIAIMHFGVRCGSLMLLLFSDEPNQCDGIERQF